MRHLYINGNWTASQSSQAGRTIINPANGTTILTVTEADETDVDHAVAAAKAAFANPAWRNTTAAERADILRAIAEELIKDKDNFALTESRDSGKTLNEGHIDIDDVVACFRYFADIAAHHAGRVVDTGNPNAISRVVYEPVGVCSLIAPWNYPLMQMAWKIAPALAAGCTAVIKPSEVTPLTTIAFMEIVHRLELPPGVLNLVLGAGATVGNRMVENPDVDLVSFTGGLATGKRIMATAAADVKKVALELGGKNPNVVFADADFDTAVDQAMNAGFTHSGQVCSAGVRLIVEESIRDEFVAELKRRTEQIRVGKGLDENSETGPLVSAEHRDKVESYMAIGREEGATLVTGGTRPDDPDLENGFFFLPTIFDHCTSEMRIVQEEIFGPVITVETFRDEAEAIAIANDTQYGLAGGVFTSDASRAQRVAGGLRHGTVWINDYHPYLPQAEWGGFGRSGVGRELGPSGLDEYRESKHIYQNIAPEPVRWFAGTD